MPLTQVQAQEQYIVRSLMAYLNTNVVTPYNAAITSTNFQTPLGIELEFPDDPEKAPILPLIVIPHPEDSKSQQSTGMGDGTVWKCKLFRMTCFPALTDDNKPSVTAAATLRSYMDYALGTGLYIPIYDYSQSPAPQVEAARIVQSKIIPAPRSFAPLLAQEKHVFDYQLILEYPVVAING